MYRDTRMIEPLEEEFFSTADKILKLSDYLAEEIIIDNIEQQLEAEIDTLTDRLNYISFFREKYEAISSDDDYYDKDYLCSALENVSTLTSQLIEKRYGVKLGEDLEFANPIDYMRDMETLYEFLFIRNYENIVNYISFKLQKNRAEFIKKYSDSIQEEQHSKDLFVIQARKKFKDTDDVTLMHFLNEIIEDIVDSTESAYLLFDTIVNLDLFEEFNNRMSELLQNYGNKIVLNDDFGSAKLYLKPLKTPSVKNEVRNQVLMKYLEGVEVNE